MIPDPFDVALFARRLEERNGRQIRLVPMPTVHGAPCGLWVQVERTDYVFYTTNTTRLHQTHIVLHEFGHVVLDHQGCSDNKTILQLLSPDLDPTLIGRMLCRSGVDDGSAEEEAAETFADLILAPRALTARSYDLPPAPDLPAEVAQVVANIEQAWGRGPR